MPTVTGTLTGGSPILSYNLQFDNNTSTFITLIGENPDNLLLTYTRSGLLSNRIYGFRYRVRNKHGWGPLSNIIYIRAATLPS